MASQVHTEKRGGCTGPGTKEAAGDEVAPWDTSSAGNPPLPEDDQTVYPQGSLSLVNKIHVEDVEDRLYRIHVLCYCA